MYLGLAKGAAAARLRAQGVTDRAQIENASTNAGRRAIRDVVERFTGVRIDHYAEVNLLSFYEITKAIGGVDVCLRANTVDPDSGANFRQGHQTISGADALAFVRQREGLPRQDLDRVRRQQVFLAALVKQVLSSGTLTSPQRLTGLIDAVRRSVVLDRGWQPLDFADRMRGISGGATQFFTIPVVNPDFHYDPAHPKATAVQVDPKQVRAFAAGLIAPQPAQSPQQPQQPQQPESPPSNQPAGTVDLYNASGINGLAVRVRDVLTGKGFVPGKADKATRLRNVSVVRYAPGMDHQASDLAGVLGAVHGEQDNSLPSGHIEVFLGKDYRGPGAQRFAGAPLVRLDGVPQLPVKSADSPITGDGDNCVN